MTYVITGARGYIGSALAERLASQGYALRLVSRSAGTSRTGIEYVQADLRDETSWNSLLQDARAIVHLSSRTDLRAAEADPAGDRELNVEPVLALARAARRCGVPVPVIFASTVTIVGHVHANPVNEQTPDRPCSVYDRHKLECEAILREATLEGAIRACSLRLSNVYGHGCASINANRGVLNVMLNRAIAGKPLTLFGDGAYVRDFNHLNDVADAFQRAIGDVRVCDGRSYVIASGRGYTLAEIYRLIAETAFEFTGRRCEVLRVPEPRDLHPIERRNFIGDSSLYRRFTGWRPSIEMEAGIRDFFTREMNRLQTGAAPNAAA